MYRCVIIDDEIHAIEGLKRYIEQVPGLIIVETYTDPIAALKMLFNAEKFDLILLDVNMPGISGIELSREIRAKTDKLVFTTSHTKYGYEAFEVNADGYLLKPYSLSKFLIIVYKLFPQLDKAEKLLADNNERFFFVKSKEDNLKLVKINYDDIVIIESKLNYIHIHTQDKSVFTYMSLSEMSKKLINEKDFLQFQRSFILNKHHIEYIDGNIIKMDNGFKITVGDYFRKDFNDFVNKNIIKAKRKT